MPRAGVPRDVHERLADDPVRGHLDLRGEIGDLAAHLHVDPQGTVLGGDPRGEGFRVPAHGLDEPGFVQRGRPRVGDDPA